MSDRFKEFPAGKAMHNELESPMAAEEQGNNVCA